MKNFLKLGMVCLTALSLCVLTSCNKDEDSKKANEDDGIVTEGFVDLGLTSGTQWKATNEGTDFYTFNEAKRFGKSLPDTVQYRELLTECQWTWDKDGYIVKGRNGKAMRMPATGFRDCNNDEYNVGIDAFYWTSLTLGPQRAFHFGFNASSFSINYTENCIHGAVRLGQQ